MMKVICVVGLGYIGLPTASILATHGHKVIGTDKNRNLIKRLRSGEVHIQEPGLNTMVKAGINSGNLTISEEPEEADVFIVAVPTPISPDKRAVMRHVEAAAQALVPHLRPGNLVVLESTSPPGTTVNLFAPLLAQSGLDPRRDLHIAHSPERVLPGRILAELVSNDRVIGGLTVEAAERALDIYQTFVQGDIYLTDATTAEMVKLMENTYRDVNIALANEFALVSEAVNVNVWEAIDIANRHPRVNILNPGPGVGGHCIAVDPWFLVEAAPGPAELIAASRRLNDRIPKHVAERILALLADIETPLVTALGLAYKANVDDVRESPAISVINWLKAEGCEVIPYDPHVLASNPLGLSAPSLEKAVEQSDCVVLLTDHTAFDTLDPFSIGERMRNRIVVDTRNALAHAAWQEAGFRVLVVGDGRQEEVESGILTAVA